MCGKQIGAPTWWMNGWGPPGDIVVYPAGMNPNGPVPTGPPPNYPKRITAPRAGGALGGNAPSATGR
jgi:hypothetical protein